MPTAIGPMGPSVLSGHGAPNRKERVVAVRNILEIQNVRWRSQRGHTGLVRLQQKWKTARCIMGLDEKPVATRAQRGCTSGQIDYAT